MQDKKIKRCAIYTRKSTDKGLDQEFSTLDNQRERAEAYIKLREDKGWVLVKEEYNDGGFSGSNMDRPGIQKLFDDIKAKRVDIVVVYKIDRLSRSLLDFTQMIEFFEKEEASFVSLTQDFDTSTSMGKLTLNILLSFAQFEREMISERTRDKMNAARRKGFWTGGIPPIGYDIKDKKLIINAKEAEIIEIIFKHFIETGSATEVVHALNGKGYTTKQWIAERSGKKKGGMPFTKQSIYGIIKNQVYTGKMMSHGKAYPAKHKAIISEELYLTAQAITKTKPNLRNSNTKKKPPMILAGLIRCNHCGMAMTPSH
ncbi:MAG: recombinase family protein, partial [Alphaproteobacteria bacterium]